MTRPTRTALAAVALAVLLAASGCMAPAPAPTPTSSTPPPAATPSSTPTPSATPDGTPTPEPSATPAAYDPADIGTWQISYSGIGPVVLDRPLSEVVAEIPDAPTVCRPGIDTFFDTRIVAVAADETSPVVWAMTANPGAEPDAALPTTDAGITIGSAPDRVLAAYPDAEQYTPHGGGTAYRITDGSSWIIFDLYDKPVVQAIWVLRKPVAPPEYCG